VKEDCCYVAFNPTKEEEHAAQPGTYRLPDGTSLLIGPERFRAPEVILSARWWDPNTKLKTSRPNL
jgi:centractin